MTLSTAPFFSHIQASKCLAKLQERQWQGTKNLATQTTKQKTKHWATFIPVRSEAPKLLPQPTWLGTLESSLDALRSFEKWYFTNQMFFIGVDGWLCLKYFETCYEYRWQVDIIRYRVFFVWIVILHRWQWFNHTIHKIEIREWREMFDFSIWL